MLMRTDIKDSSRMLQRNMKTIRTWLEESQSAASTCVLHLAYRSVLLYPGVRACCNLIHW